MSATRDIFFMKKALRLAEKGRGWTFPNPLVGAVVVKNNEVIGLGFHSAYGKAHAEIEAFSSLPNNIDLRDATLYVNLEPCSHFGKTPPCVDAILERKVGRVVFSHLDPDPLTNGKSLAKLRAAGVQTEVGILADEAKELNENFITFHTKNRPFIAVKFAASLDGKTATATGNSKWITNEVSRNFARLQRAKYQAILVGKNTVMLDNPNLGCHDKKYQDPIRIILDSDLEIPLDFQVFRDDRVIVATTDRAPKAKIAELEKKNIRVLVFPKKIAVPESVSELTKLSITGILVEGGSTVVGSFFDARLVDKVYAYHAPIVIGGENSLSAVGGEGVSKVANASVLTHVKHKIFGDNVLTYGYVSHRETSFAVHK